jgi:hypothetical protein
MSLNPNALAGDRIGYRMGTVLQSEKKWPCDTCADGLSQKKENSLAVSLLQYARRTTGTGTSRNRRRSIGHLVPHACATQLILWARSTVRDINLRRRACAISRRGRTAFVQSFVALQVVVTCKHGGAARAPEGAFGGVDARGDCIVAQMSCRRTAAADGDAGENAERLNETT